MAKLPKLPKLSLGFALSAALLPLLCFSYVSASHARIGGHWNDALIDGGTFDSEPKLDSSEDSGLEVNRQSDATAPVECGHYFLNPGQSMTIKSKNYPGKHPIRHTCKWFFQGTSRDSTISMTCNDFQLQGEEYGCLTLKGGRLKTKACNEVRRYKNKSGNDKLEVSFVTRGKAGNGFQCTVTALDMMDKLRCKEGWKCFENSCYFFSTEKLTWEEGRAACQNMDSDYLKISTQGEFDFIDSTLLSLSFSGIPLMWVGLNDLEVEDTFKWVSDGTLLPDQRDSPWWALGEPNDVSVQDCIYFRREKGLGDLSCSFVCRYICEVPNRICLE